MAEADDLIAEVANRRQAWVTALTAHDLAAPRHPLLDQTLPRVWEASDFVARSCIRYPEILPQLLASGRLERPSAQGEIDRLLAADLEGVTDDGSLAVALRRFRRREMVRIIWRDLAALAGLDETLEDLSALADACVDRSLTLLHGWLAAEIGTPPGRGRHRAGYGSAGNGQAGGTRAQSLLGHRPPVRLYRWRPHG